MVLKDPGVIVLPFIKKLAKRKLTINPVKTHTINIANNCEDANNLLFLVTEYYVYHKTKSFSILLRSTLGVEKSCYNLNVKFYIELFQRILTIWSCASFFNLKLEDEHTMNILSLLIVEIDLI